MQFATFVISLLVLGYGGATPLPQLAGIVPQSAATQPNIAGQQTGPPKVGQMPGRAPGTQNGGTPPNGGASPMEAGQNGNQNPNNGNGNPNVTPNPSATPNPN